MLAGCCRECINLALPVHVWRTVWLPGSASSPPCRLRRSHGALTCVSRCTLLCVVLCCAVLCCAVLCCAVLCCAVLCCAVLCRTS
jgi:hypothetical protein